jgi:hypothetical protein
MNDVVRPLHDRPLARDGVKNVADVVGVDA